ncbi:hypothetical protein H8959_013702 [Pygathrix nigripes]
MWPTTGWLPCTTGWAMASWLAALHHWLGHGKLAGRPAPLVGPWQAGGALLPQDPVALQLVAGVRRGDVLLREGVPGARNGPVATLELCTQLEELARLADKTQLPSWPGPTLKNSVSARKAGT